MKIEEILVVLIIVLIVVTVCFFFRLGMIVIVRLVEKKELNWKEMIDEALEDPSDP